MGPETIEGWRTSLRLWMGVSLVLGIVVAWLTPGFLQPDEHHQILELVSFKLGRTPEADLAWEHRAQVRPFLQPLAYCVLAKISGLDDPHALARLFRIATALFGWLGTFALASAYPRWLSTRSGLSLALIATALAYFQPLIHARTSSEAASGSVMLLALSLFARLSPGLDGSPADRRWSVVLVAFGLAGVAFLLRYQIALMLIGVGLWCLVVARIGISRIVAGAAVFVAMVLVGVLVDRWGYGEWVLTSWRYFQVNLIEGKASEFGVRPTWAYVGLLWHDLGKPFGALVILALIGAAVRAKHHLLVWASIPFVLGHALIAHKETRFLFPYLFLTPALFALALEGPLLWKKWVRGLGWALLVVNTFMLVTNHGFHLNGGPFREALSRAVGDRASVSIYYTGELPMGLEKPRMTFLRPAGWAIEEMTIEEIEARLAAPYEPFFYAHQARHSRRPSMPRLEAECVERYHEPWILPDSVMDHAALRRLFELRVVRTLFECPKK